MLFTETAVAAVHDLSKKVYPDNQVIKYASVERSQIIFNSKSVFKGKF